MEEAMEPNINIFVTSSSSFLSWFEVIEKEIKIMYLIA